MRKMSLRLFITLAFTLGLLTLGPATFAQVAADLSGTTKDVSGAVIPNVAVTARNTATNLTRDTQSDEQGRYAFPSLPIGNYEMTASSRPTFSKASRARSSWASVWALVTMVRIRARPSGTVG